MSPKQNVPAKSESAKRREFSERVAQVYRVKPEEVRVLLNGKRKQSVRVHALGLKPADAIQAELETTGDLEPIPWCPNASFITGRKGDIVKSPLFLEGSVYIQNASSLIPVLCLGPQPDEDILDLAAAPGGKASHIASLTENRAKLWLNDGLAARLAKLRSVASLMSIEFEEITSFPAQYADKFISNRFDRILLDAQCTGEGRVDLHKSNALKHWSLERVQEYGFLQQRMITSAFKLLKPGGVLVYTTCTISPEENERPVDSLLARFPDASVVPVDLDLGDDVSMPGLTSWQGKSFHPSLSDAIRVRPSEFFEPFFVCKLQKA